MDQKIEEKTIDLFNKSSDRFVYDDNVTYIIESYHYNFIFLTSE